MKRKDNIIVHFGASTWTAKVRDATGEFVTFDLRRMDKQGERTFIRELTKAFRESRIAA